MHNRASVQYFGDAAAPAMCSRVSEFGFIRETEPGTGAETDYGQQHSVETDLRSAAAQPNPRQARTGRETGSPIAATDTQSEPELSFIVHISDEDYRSAWRPCPALEAEPPED